MANLALNRPRRSRFANPLQLFFKPILLAFHLLVQPNYGDNTITCQIDRHAPNLDSRTCTEDNWSSQILLCCAPQRSLANFCGNTREELLHRRGLRQGGPLSPTFFILVMGFLNCMVEKANNEGLLQPLATRNIHHHVSI
jgi:hypothetical protein